jgi:hypothetical protein
MMEKVKLYSVIMAVLWFLSLGSFAGAEDAGESAEPERKVTGVVKDQAGSPIRGAQVAALPMSDRYITTDAEGKFEISLTEEWVEEGYGLYLVARHQEFNQAGVLEVDAGTKKVGIKLEPALVLRGAVRDPGDKPISKAKVHLVMSSTGPFVGPSITDAKGRYEFKVLPQKQEYSIFARAVGYGPGKINSLTINMKKDVAEVAPLVLKPADMSVSGRVIDGDGKPVAGAKVSMDGDGQPEHLETKSDGQGKFKLEGICRGSITVAAATESGLEGRTLSLQAGQENVEIIVFREYEELPHKVWSNPPDPQKQGLRYHWSRSAWGLVEGGTVQQMRPSTEKPEGVRLPEFKHKKDALFCRWVCPMAKEGFLWIALDHTRKYGPHDRLFIDSNGDGHLDDEVVAAAHTTWRHLRAWFGPVKVVFETEDGPIDYHLSFYFYDYPDNLGLNAGSAGWYEGDVSVGDVQRHCLLVDKDGNGTFDTKSLNLADCDLIAFGEEDDRIVRFVGDFVEIDGVLYRLDVARDGEYMNVNLTPPEDVKFGILKLHEDITEFAAGGENGLFTVKPTNGVAKLPVGKYRIDHWLIERKDEKGKKWTLRGHSFNKSGIFEVSEGRETKLAVDEPIMSSLEKVTKEGVRYSFINPSLHGRLGESLDLARNDDHVPAQLRIRSKDGSYDRSFAFEYG